MDTGYNTYMCVNYLKNGINEKDQVACIIFTLKRTSSFVYNIVSMLRDSELVNAFAEKLHQNALICALVNLGKLKFLYS